MDIEIVRGERDQILGVLRKACAKWLDPDDRLCEVLDMLVESLNYHIVPFDICMAKGGNLRAVGGPAYLTYATVCCGAEHLMNKMRRCEQLCQASNPEEHRPEFKAALEHAKALLQLLRESRIRDSETRVG